MISSVMFLTAPSPFFYLYPADFKQMGPPLCAAALLSFASACKCEEFAQFLNSKIRFN